jgi:hypothetical protein
MDSPYQNDGEQFNAYMSNVFGKNSDTLKNVVRTAVRIGRGSRGLTLTVLEQGGRRK